MKSSQNYVLILGQPSDDLQMLEALLEHLSCPMVFASSTDQVVAKVSQMAPYLVILAGDGQNWSQALVEDLRNAADTCETTIVALTDCNAPSWMHQEENPGVDGFLVKPISRDVLTSLVQSAWARQTYCSASYAS
jgi:AmiR/NasT family two-component response regulator